MGIPIVSLLDTNCDPELSNLPIPANDDAIRSIRLILGRLADAVYEGQHGQAVSSEEYAAFAQGMGEAEASEAPDESEQPEERVPAGGAEA